MKDKIIVQVSLGRPKILDQVVGRVFNQVRWQVSKHVRDQVRNQVQVRGQVWGQMKVILDQIYLEVENEKQD